MDVVTAQDKSSDFFSAPRQTVARESILMNKLLLDLQTAASRNGYYLRAYGVDVDNHGYDLILDCDLNIRKFQVKTVLKSATTSSWDIRASIIKPSIDEMNDVSFWSTTLPGLGGGLIVMEFDVSSNGIDANYYYIDLDLISIFRLGWFGGIAQKDAAALLLSQILHSQFNSQIEIRKSLLLRPRDAECLLDLARMRSRMETIWRHLFRKSNGGLSAQTGLPPRDAVAAIIANQLSQITA